MKCIVTIQTKRWKRRGHCPQKNFVLAEIIGLWNIIISYRETQKNMKNFSMKIKYLAFLFYFKPMNDDFHNNSSNLWTF